MINTDGGSMTLDAIVRFNSASPRWIPSFTPSEDTDNKLSSRPDTTKPNT